MWWSQGVLERHCDNENLGSVRHLVAILASPSASAVDGKAIRVGLDGVVPFILSCQGPVELVY